MIEVFRISNADTVCGDVSISWLRFAGAPATMIPEFKVRKVGNTSTRDRVFFKAV